MYLVLSSPSRGHTVGVGLAGSRVAAASGLDRLVMLLHCLVMLLQAARMLLHCHRSQHPASHAEGIQTCFPVELTYRGGQDAPGDSAASLPLCHAQSLDAGCTRSRHPGSGRVISDDSGKGLPGTHPLGEPNSRKQTGVASATTSWRGRWVGTSLSVLSGISSQR